MKTLLFIAATIVALIIVVGIIFTITGRERNWERIAGSPDRGRLDFSNLTRSPTGNDALACTTGLGEGCDMTLPSFPAPLEQLAQKLANRIESVDPLARRVDDGTAPEHLRYVTYSPNMRFPDLINIEIVEMPEGNLGIQAYVRAQLGSDDFGANRKRLTTIFEGFQ
ncbi:MAG: DUF1499 domain-containing protein [Pseudomonadota bacterium]